MLDARYSADYLRSLTPGQLKRTILSLSQAEALAILHDWEFWARPEQLPPPGDWILWLIRAGRGFGKTRTGAETTNQWAENEEAKQILIAGRTAGDVRSLMIEGPAGILACSKPWFRPLYEPSKRQLTWPNGVIGVIRYGDEPDGFRGFEGARAWLDELFHWGRAQDAYDNLMFGMRERGSDGGVRILVTSTPKPTKLCKALIKDPDTVVVNGSTYANSANLDPKWLAKVKQKYEGTRLGRQELHGEVLEDNPGASWTYEIIDRTRVEPDQVPPLDRIVVGIDPAASHGPDSDETGIVVAGRAANGHGYRLQDLSLRAKPDGDDGWAKTAVGAYHRWNANAIVVEDNNGGDMAEAVLRVVDKSVPIIRVRAKNGKRVRAEPIAMLDEQGMIHSVGTGLVELESQMATVDLDAGDDHDDRIDAYVHAMTELLLDGGGSGDPLAALRAMTG
jgi:phage terminase large subunit-like protein